MYNIRRDLINRMFDAEMNKDFDAYRSANDALDKYHSMYPANASVRDNYDDILNEQITKDFGYQSATAKEALEDYHSLFGRGSKLDLSTVPEAAKHPLTDPDEIGLRMVNAIAPNEQTEADIEYMKKLREYNSL